MLNMDQIWFFPVQHCLKSVQGLALPKCVQENPRAAPRAESRSVDPDVIFFALCKCARLV
jgi:hypothetical protein